MTRQEQWCCSGPSLLHGAVGLQRFPNKLHDDKRAATIWRSVEYSSSNSSSRCPRSQNTTQRHRDTATQRELGQSAKTYFDRYQRRRAPAGPSHLLHQEVETHSTLQLCSSSYLLWCLGNFQGHVITIFWWKWCKGESQSLRWHCDVLKHSVTSAECPPPPTGPGPHLVLSLAPLPLSCHL